MDTRGAPLWPKEVGNLFHWQQQLSLEHYSKPPTLEGTHLVGESLFNSVTITTKQPQESYNDLECVYAFTLQSVLTPNICIVSTGHIVAS